MLCSTDLPTRALVSNMKAFNGAYACSTCEDKGSTMPRKKLHRIWPFTPTNTIRTKDSTYLAFSSAIQQGNAVRLIYTPTVNTVSVIDLYNILPKVLGYKGFPVMASHPPFDAVSGMVTDYMHCVLLGVHGQDSTVYVVGLQTSL